MSKRHVEGDVSDKLPKRILVVEDDPTAKAAVVKVLTDLGIKHVEAADTSEAAWAALRLADFDFIVLDWKLSPASGAAVLHRLRFMAKTQDVPVLVVSGVIGKRDFLFGEEYLFTSLIEKPFEPGPLAEKIKEMTAEANWWRGECKKLEELAAQTVKDDDAPISALLDELSSAPRPVPLGFGAARALLARGQIPAAKRVLDKVIEWDGRCALALTLLGKINLVEQNFAEAKKYLMQAHSLFPKNSERLVMLGDTHMNMLEFEQADRAFSEATEADPKNERAKAGAELANATSRFFGQLEIGKSPSSLPSVFNSIGVGLVHSRRYDEGFLYYQNALKYIENAETKGRVAFNLGLGYLKAKRWSEALEWFRKSDQFCAGTFQKAREYISKLELHGVKEGSEGGAHSPSEDDDTLPAFETEIPGAAPSGAQWKPIGQHPNDGMPVAAPAQKNGGTLQLVQVLLTKLDVSDSRLFGYAKVSKLESSHQAFSVEHDGAKYALFILKTQSAEELAKPSRAASVKRNVLVFHLSSEGSYQQIWPEEASEQEKKSA